MAEYIYPVQPSIPSGSGYATETKQDSILTEVTRYDVVDFLDSGVVDTSSTNILTTGTSVVASLAAECDEIEVVDDIGEYMSIRDGGGTVLAYLPLGGGRVKVNIAAATNVKLYSETGATINVGKIAINFLG